MLVEVLAVLIAATTVPAHAAALDELLPLWPLPATFSKGLTPVVVAGPKLFSLQVEAAEPAATLLQTAFKRLLPQIFMHGQPEGSGLIAATPSDLVGLHVRVTEPDTELQLGADETYSLEVPVRGSAQLRAKTVFGAYHGLQTFSQLVAFNFTSESYEVAMAPWSIKDVPRYPHRELLVDTGRHFLPIPVLKQLIDSMTMAKINVLHWHIIDWQSFPAASRVFPELAEKGAFSPMERYTWAEMKEIVEYSRERGIRVVPEFDVPAHSSSWHKSHPELFPSNCSSALDPANERVYSFYKELLTDWSAVFTDHIFHLGTDELPTSCWNNTKDIDFMHRHGLQGLDDLFGYFVKRVVHIAESVGKRAHVWDESIIRTNLTPSEAVIQIWHSTGGLRERALSQGHDVVYSPDGPWYLDGLSTTWEQMYMEEPELPNVTGPGKIIGGGGEMWGETVDPSDLEATIWPRMAAIAERLWSPKKETALGPAAAQKRLLAFRCLLLQRGVRTDVVGGKGRASLAGPGSCLQHVLPAQDAPVQAQRDQRHHPSVITI